MIVCNITGISSRGVNPNPVVKITAYPDNRVFFVRTMCLVLSIFFFFFFVIRNANG